LIPQLYRAFVHEKLTARQTVKKKSLSFMAPQSSFPGSHQPANGP